MRLIGNLFSKSLARTWIIASALIVILAGTCFTIVQAYSKQIIITEGGQILSKGITYKSTVKELLQERGILLNNGDKTSVPMDSPLSKEMQIEICRAMPVTVVAAGESKPYLTTKRTTGEILAELGYSVTDADLVTPGIKDSVTASSEITLVKTTFDTQTEDKDIPFKQITKNNSSMLKGQKNVVQEGQNGVEQTTYKVCYQDGVEVSREATGTQIVKESVDKIIDVGTKAESTSAVVAMRGTLPDTSRGEDLRYSKVISCTATAYSIHGGTATGRQSQYGVIAVDPKVIPLNSRLYVEAPDGSWVYGLAVAGDTGGAIKGNKIDLFFDTESECNRFGVRKATVYVLD